MNKHTQRLVLSSIMIALATILSLITVYKLPYGGSITLASMLPILFVGYIYGIKWGILTGIIYGIIQAILGAAGSAAFAGLDAFSIILVLFLDYIVAFGVLGFSGLFKGRLKNCSLAFGTGILVATLLRYLTHFLSGYIIYGSYAEWFFSQEGVAFGETVLNKYSGKALAAIYSMIYNGTYMVPEIIISVIAGVCIINISPIKKFCKN